MDDLISRQAAIDAVRKKIADYIPLLHGWLNGLPIGIEMEIRQVPSAQKKGHWLYPTDVKGFCRCEYCGALWGRDLYENRFFKYCPRCGADMRGEDDG